MSKNPDYRPTFSRSLFLSGEIGEDSVAKLIPDILRLQSESRDPISLHIDSYGGSIYHSDSIYNLLKARSQDSDPCRLITIAVTQAMSAAADLLSAGDYALAYPDSLILHHGTRRSQNAALTTEGATLVADSLKRSNEKYASRLADRSIERFLFRYIYLQGESDGRRQNPQISPSELMKRFLVVLRTHVSKEASEILDQSYNQYQQTIKIRDFVLTQLSASTAAHARPADLEAKILESIIKFELQANSDPDWSFQYGGLNQLQEDFLLLTSYHVGEMNKPLIPYIQRWAYFLLSEEEQEEFRSVKFDDESEFLSAKTGDLIRELWLYFSALCRTLQAGDNLLTAPDCFWLGMIDEVVGRPDLPPVRLIMEGDDQ